jgi:hypothetical protein
MSALAGFARGLVTGKQNPGAREIDVEAWDAIGKHLESLRKLILRRSNGRKCAREIAIRAADAP